MEGIYKIKAAEIDGYFQKHIIRVIIIIVLINLGLIIFTAFQDDFETTVIAGILLVFISFIGIVLGLIVNERIKPKYENYRLELTGDGIIREGEGVPRLEFKYSEIGVILKYNSIIILKKGIINNLLYSQSRYISINHYNLIVIPKILEDFEKVKSFIKSKSF